MSLLEELFPEAKPQKQVVVTEPQKQYPKLDPPVRGSSQAVPLPREKPKSRRQYIRDAIQIRGSEVTVLKLSHCSTELTESDFRRAIPRGKHIEEWMRDGEYYKIIPGREPIR